MPRTAQHQRRRVAKAARRKAIVAEKKRHGSSTSDLAERVRFAAKCPIALCVMPSGLFEIGMGSIVIARELPSGLLGCGYFLVDAFCLGVKDAVFGEMEEGQLRSYLAAQRATQTFVDLEPACARKLIRDAVAYAADLGLSAAKDYHAVELIFGDIDADACSDTFTFGKDGKPLYVSGPLDTPARIRAIALSIQNRFGVDASDSLIEAPRDAPASEVPGQGPDDQ